MEANRKSITPTTHGKKRPAKDNRIILSGMMWIVRSGAQCREFEFRTFIVFVSDSVHPKKLQMHLYIYFKLYVSHYIVYLL